jgi:hypothetical protein
MTKECTQVYDYILMGLLNATWPTNLRGVDKLIKYRLSDDFKLSHQSKLMAPSIEKLISFSDPQLIPESLRLQIKNILAEITDITNGIFLFQEDTTLTADNPGIVIGICGREYVLDFAVNNKYHKDIYSVPTTTAFTIIDVSAQRMKAASVCLPSEILTTYSEAQRSYMIRHELLHAVTSVRDIDQSDTFGKYFLHEIYQNPSPGQCSALLYRSSKADALHLFTHYPDTDQRFFKLAANITEVELRYSKPFIAEQLKSRYTEKSIAQAMLYTVVNDMTRGVCDGLNQTGYNLSNGVICAITFIAVSSIMLSCNEPLLFIGYLTFLTILLPELISPLIKSLYQSETENVAFLGKVLKFISPAVTLLMLLYQNNVGENANNLTPFLIQTAVNKGIGAIGYQGAKATTKLVVYGFSALKSKAIDNILPTYAPAVSLTRKTM